MESDFPFTPCCEHGGDQHTSKVSGWAAEGSALGFVPIQHQPHPLWAAAFWPNAGTARWLSCCAAQASQEFGLEGF